MVLTTLICLEVTKATSNSHQCLQQYFSFRDRFHWVSQRPCKGCFCISLNCCSTFAVFHTSFALLNLPYFNGIHNCNLLLSVIQSVGCNHLVNCYLTIILRNRAEYHLIRSRRGRRPSWLNQGIFRKIEQDNCFIIQQIPIAYHSQNEKNYGSMIKTLKASNT